jgi:S1-C subfamily serine protease
VDRAGRPRITSAVPAAAAAEAGLALDDAVVAVNGRLVRRVADLAAAVTGTRDPVTLLLQRSVDSSQYYQVAARLEVAAPGARSWGPGTGTDVFNP